MKTSSKILVFGDASHDTEAAITKANAINKKNGPFDALILLGPGFSTSKGIENSDIPLYIYGENSESLQNDGNDSSSSTLVTPVSPVKTTKGITIAAADSKNSGSQPSADILISTHWPAGLETGNEPKYPDSEVVRDAVIRTKPRYHLVSAGGDFHERAPYKWDDNDKYTRFINLDKFGGSTKWFYAFNILDIDDGEQPKGAITENPWSTKKRALDNDNDHNNGEDRDNGGRSKKIKKPKKAKEKKQAVVTPESCFFCLSCPQLDKNLIVSIADETYLALAKGPLTTEQQTGSLKSPGHVLIIPIQHVPTYSTLSLESRKAVELEKHKYMVALRETFKQAQLSCVAFEISRSRGVHVHTQVIPIPLSKEADVEELFLQEAEKAGIAMYKRQLDQDESEFFKVTLPDDSTLVSELKNVRFDLQFGRKVLAKLMGIEERVDWRACSQAAHQEARDAAQFKESFKAFDFTV